MQVFYYCKAPGILLLQSISDIISTDEDPGLRIESYEIRGRIYKYKL